MHEMSLVHALFDQADRAIAPHSAAAVRHIKVRIGALAGVEPELFRTAFEGCREERGYLEAALDIVEQDAAFRCVECGAVVASGAPLVCAACAGDVRLSAGGELVLERVELEIPNV
jgi:hydrogenase nickel incorporation protein HypA/HybF